MSAIKNNSKYNDINKKVIIYNFFYKITLPTFKIKTNNKIVI